MKLLCLSDVEVPAVYSSRIRERFPGLDAVISCGDLPWYYLEYVVSMLDLPLYYVQGNHVFDVEDSEGEVRHQPQGAINLHRQVIYDPQLDLILAGIEGSLLYNRRAYQYTQRQMWQMVFWTGAPVTVQQNALWALPGHICHPCGSNRNPRRG